MPENENPAPVAEVAESVDSAPEFTPITSQEELDKILGQRLARQKAQYAGYAEYKEKAEKYDAFEQSQKTELERAQEALKAAEDRANQAEQARLRSDVAREKGVPAEALTGSTLEELQASAELLVQWRDSNKPVPTKVPTATSAGPLKSGVAGDPNSTLDPKDRAAEAMRRLRSGT